MRPSTSNSRIPVYKTALRTLLISSVTLVGTACTNLSAVSDLSQSLTSASASWDDVASDVAGSCQRRIAISSAGTDCHAEQAASDGLIAANTVLREYFEALGAASNESSFRADDGIEALAGSIGAIPGVNADHVAAASGLATFLGRLGTERLRERTLRQLIDQGAPPASDVVTMMDEVLVTRLTRLLGDEERVLRGAFVQWLQDERFENFALITAYCAQPTPGFFGRETDGPSYLLVEAYCQRAGVIAARRKAIDEYQKSLAIARDALDTLQSSRVKLSGKQLAANLYRIGSDLDDQIKAVRKAFG